MCGVTADVDMVTASCAAAQMNLASSSAKQVIPSAFRGAARGFEPTRKKKGPASRRPQFRKKFDLIYAAALVPISAGTG